jgi:hypothetical protein
MCSLYKLKRVKKQILKRKIACLWRMEEGG